MKTRLGLVHWRMEEAGPLIAMLESWGYEVHYGNEQRPIRVTELKKLDPYAAVVDLSRMPSYGKYWAAELRQTSLKNLPIVFVDGDPERVKGVREAIPDAVYVSRAGLERALRVIKPVSNPVQPERMMASTRSAAVKLGVKPGMRVGVNDAPRGYASVIGVLPEGASFEEEPADAAPVTLWFVRDADVYLAGLRAMKKVAAKSKLWVLYPKQQKGKQVSNLTQALVREAGIKVGLVEYKICSVDAVWTGLAFAVKKPV